MLAYLTHHLPMHAAKVAALVRENFAAPPAGQPIRVLDIGAGPLSAIVGTRLALGRPLVAKALDRAGAMMQLGATVLRELYPDVDVTLETASASDAPGRARAFSPHLLIAANVLGELERPDELATRLWDALAPGANLLLLEPGTRIHGKGLIRVREALRSARPVQIVAPCVGHPDCPFAAGNDWCHSERPVDWPRPYIDLAARAGLRPEALKFSYLWLARTEAKTGQRHLRVIGGPMQPTPSVMLRYACGPDGRVTLRAAAGSEQGQKLRGVVRGGLFEPGAGIEQVREAVVAPPRRRGHDGGSGMTRRRGGTQSRRRPS